MLHLINTVRAINRHGKSCKYISVVEGEYNIEIGSSVNTETEYNVCIYKKHLRANQYNFPTLIGKEAAIFYLANHKLLFTPAVRDKIMFDSVTYTIDSITEHAADHATVLYKIVAVKG
jgi:hypothetical protein